ncbi:MAG: hypothetical protein V1913_03060 [Fibrobacterota bacterium]
MPKLKRWIVVHRNMAVLTPDVRDRIVALGGNLASSKNEVSQTINVNGKNREAIIALLKENGYTVTESEDEPLSE